MKALFTETLKRSRKEQNILQRQLASFLEIDTPLYSKIERGERIARKDTVLKIAEFLKLEKEDLLAEWLADQFLKIIDEENLEKGIINISLKKIIEN